MNNSTKDDNVLFEVYLLDILIRNGVSEAESNRFIKRITKVKRNFKTLKNHVEKTIQYKKPHNGYIKIEESLKRIIKKDLIYSGIVNTNLKK